jgi:hypothetical protein
LNDSDRERAKKEGIIEVSLPFMFNVSQIIFVCIFSNNALNGKDVVITIKWVIGEILLICY